MANKNPTGRAKGGKRYPKVNLEKIVEYTKRLVSKTHTGPQPKEVVLPGVFDSNTWLGGQRLSATKQFGLIEGDSKAYSATGLAKKINSATPDELQNYLQESCLKPMIFKSLFDTFHNETVSQAKLKQQALTLGVHPDLGEECIEIFTSSLIYTGLGSQVESDKIQIIEASSIIVEPEDFNSEEEETEEKPQNETPPTLSPFNQQNQSFQSTKKQGASNVNVNIDIDPSMDPEKLEKLLKLLKGYGAI